IENIKPGKRETAVDAWHPDTNASNSLLVLPEILTTASRWPTQFLIGRVAVTLQQFRYASERSFEMAFWKQPEREDAIRAALERGDAYIHRFQPGEVVKAPPGILHRRHIPE